MVKTLSMQLKRRRMDKKLLMILRKVLIKSMLLLKVPIKLLVMLKMPTKKELTKLPLLLMPLLLKAMLPSKRKEKRLTLKLLMQLSLLIRPQTKLLKQSRMLPPSEDAQIEFKLFKY